MNKIFKFFLIISLSFLLPAHALQLLDTKSMDEKKTYKIEVLQVTDIVPYRESLQGFIKTLSNNGIVEGENLVINHVKIDFDIENGGFWDRISLLGRIRSEADRITRVKPDLVLTIGTPATRYARPILETARIPVVFTAVSNPLDAGAISLVDAGAGATGATLHIDMAHSMELVKQMLPSATKIGMVYTDDENGVTHVEAARSNGEPLGIKVLAQQVNKRDSIIPALKRLYEDGKGVQLFGVPLDTYYAMRKFEPTNDLSDFAVERNIPIVSFALSAVPGAAMYIGADFGTVGGLSGVQALKILKQRKQPDTLPILRQPTPTVLIDPKRVDALHIQLPASISERKSVRSDGLWEISVDKKPAKAM